MKILLMGANGQLGKEIIDAAQKENLTINAYTHQQLSITDIKKVECVIVEKKPNYIINTAAYTAVDKAETEQELVFLVNAIGVKYLAKLAKKYDIPLLHFSTDYIFDGKKKRAYTEEDEANPLSIYGQSKLSGENLLKETWNKHIILRVSWVFSAYGTNFVKTIINLARTRSQLPIISDQIGAPTYAGAIAETLLKIIKCLHQGQTNWGTYHYTGFPVTNWYEFAKKIIIQGEINHKLRLTNILPILAVEYPSIAQRPYNSALNCNKIKHIFAIRQCNWHDGLVKTISCLV